MYGQLYKAPRKQVKVQNTRNYKKGLRHISNRILETELVPAFLEDEKQHYAQKEKKENSATCFYFLDDKAF